MIRQLACVFLLAAATAACAEPCNDNFTAEGSVFTGKTYKSWAVLPGVRPQDAFTRSYAFTAENGFTVLSSNKEAGVISAAQSVSYGKGKSVPLTVTLRAEGDGTRIAISYATSGGLVSPEDAIRRHFCMTMAAAAAGPAQAATPAVASTQGATGAVPAAAPARAPTPRGFAELSPEQHQAVTRELAKVIPTAQVRQLAQEAAPAIGAYVERESCLSSYEGASAMNEFAAPGAYLAGWGSAPMHSARYHNKASCMTVARVQGWTAPANNALRFEVLYKAEDSGETWKLNHEVVRQPDGAWLFTQ